MKVNFEQAYWIGAGHTLLNWRSPVRPAPCFRHKFSLPLNFSKAEIFICAPGYYELYINSRKVGNRVLNPVVSIFDKRVYVTRYEVSDYLQPGENLIGVMLGNGWYNCHTADGWQFDKASWRDYPKMRLQLNVDGHCVSASGKDDYMVAEGPIIFDGLRNGEVYDARKELKDWLTIDYDPENYRSAVRAAPPGGELCFDETTPIEILEFLPMRKVKDNLYDAGCNLAGWTRITAKGRAGDKVTIRYGEQIVNGHLDTSAIDRGVESGNFQTDVYIMAGCGEETYQPRFTYHGFRYIELNIEGEACLISIEAVKVGSAFAEAGELTTGSATANELQACFLRSYRSNFVGIPTDCPHREKNGWTGDALLAAESGLCNFDSADAYLPFLQALCDSQRPSGQLPGIVPTGGWGFNWGSGPAWDSALVILPGLLYQFTGNDRAVKMVYASVKKYLTFCREMSSGGLLNFGLGDWCHVDKSRMAPVELTSSACHFNNLVTAAQYAKILDKESDAVLFKQESQRVMEAFNKKFYHGNGLYAEGELTSLAAPLYHNLVPPSETGTVAGLLAKKVKAGACRADFGILGAKYVPRVLADAGYSNLAGRIFTQPQFPGWGYWIARHATSLWEDWDGSTSQNHVMYGDFSAWYYSYAGGFRHDWEHIGARSIRIKPQVIQELNPFCASHHGYSSNWHKEDGEWTGTVTIPAGASATVQLPGEDECILNSGTYHWRIKDVDSQTDI